MRKTESDNNKHRHEHSNLDELALAPFRAPQMPTRRVPLPVGPFPNHYGTTVRTDASRLSLHGTYVQTLTLETRGAPVPEPGHVHEAGR